MTHEPRFYREWINTPDLVTFHVSIKETDLQVRAGKDLTAEATEARISMALQLKVDELILKPFTLEILERKILRVIQ